ncbi:MAG TPA: class I SAM-dependent methyltransferase, partial [Anaerolineaceae bacterium]|nr:class I SAM-dependent methyltransferase [Anaerolineaceae bacterium]
SFYDELGPSFSVTRAQIQPGVKRLLPEMLAQPKILDLGCGNGTLAEALALANFEGMYLGLDGSLTLLGFAVERMRPYPLTKASFQFADLLDENLATSCGRQGWPLIVCFATLQHLPSRAAHLQFFKNAHRMLAPGGRLMFSCWQIHNSVRLTKHIMDWSLLGISDEALEPGDLLMDWRGQDSQKPGLRYVHEFRAEELNGLGEEVGLSLGDTFYSDGGEGNLALYQTWNKSEGSRE